MKSRVAISRTGITKNLKHMNTGSINIDPQVPLAYAGKNFGGFKVGGPASEGVRWAEPPGRRRIFENLQKIPEENGKNAVFSPILQRNFKTMRSIFARLDEKQLFGKF